MKNQNNNCRRGPLSKDIALNYIVATVDVFCTASGVTLLCIAKYNPYTGVKNLWKSLIFKKIVLTNDRKNWGYEHSNDKGRLVMRLFWSFANIVPIRDYIFLADSLWSFLKGDIEIEIFCLVKHVHLLLFLHWFICGESESKHTSIGHTHRADDSLKASQKAYLPLMSDH